MTVVDMHRSMSLESIFCVEERRGLINFSGINEKAYRTQPIGKKCRCGQY